MFHFKNGIFAIFVKKKNNVEFFKKHLTIFFLNNVLHVTHSNVFRDVNHSEVSIST